MKTQEQKNLIKSPESYPFYLICLIQVIFACILGALFAVLSCFEVAPTISLIVIFLLYYVIAFYLDIKMISDSINKKVYRTYYFIEGIVKVSTYGVISLFIFSRIPIKEALINTIIQSRLASSLANFIVGVVLLLIPMWVAMGVVIKYKEKMC